MVQNASEKPFLRNFISTVEGKTNRYLKKKYIRIDGSYTKSF